MTTVLPAAFCDWLSMYCIHPQGGLPIINDGNAIRVKSQRPDRWLDAETGKWAMGVPVEDVEFCAPRSHQHVASFDSSIMIRCDGYRIEIDGNISRLGRPDNLFGLSVLDCFTKANELLRGMYGIPEAFKCCEETEQYATSGTFIQTNAVITRVDVTMNYAAGSAVKARRVINAMCGQSVQRTGKNSAPKSYGNGVTWNEGSKRWYAKLYIKADSLGEHVTPEVAQYCADNGIVRHEVSLKARELADRGLQSLLGWARRKEGIPMENVIYADFGEIFHRNTVSHTDFSDMPRSIAKLARDYYNGADLWHDDTYTKRTRQLWRKKLLPYGLDIATPPNALRFATRVQVVDLQPLAAPAWYSINDNRLRVA